MHKEYQDEVAKIISIIRPARYPERLRPLLNAISAGRVGIIEINSVDATLGEVLVAFSSSSINVGLVVINPQMMNGLMKQWSKKCSLKRVCQNGSLSQTTALRLEMRSIN